MKCHMLWFHFAILFAATATASAQTFTNGLVAYYPFNGSAADESGHGNDGDAANAVAVPDRFGTNDSAYSFDGVSSFISFAQPPTTQIDNWSITAWVRPNSLSQYASLVCLGYEDGFSADGYALAMTGTSASAGKNFYGVFGQVSWISSGANFATSNTWYHVAMIRDAGITRFFVNGLRTPNVSSQSPKVPTAFRIGSAIGTRFFNGSIDDVRIYERALSSNEVAQLYASEAHPPGPRTATAVPNLTGGFVIGATVIDGGDGYTNTPLVHIVGGSGSGAQAVAVVSNDMVIAVNILNAGVGYTNPPTIVIQPPYIPSPVLSLTPATLVSFSSLIVSSNYQFQRKQAWYWTNDAPSFTATNSTFARAVDGNQSSQSCRLVSAPAPTQAFATAQIANGFLVSANVTAAGSSYPSPPQVAVVGGGGSGGTAATSLTNGRVSAVTITSAGFGYITPPTLQIAPPPAIGFSPTVSPAARLDITELSPYDAYRVQTSSAADGVWQNWNTPFTPTASTNTQYLLSLPNNLGLIRVKYGP